MNIIKKIWNWGIHLLMTETMLYLIFGFFTTVISISVYFLFEAKIGLHYSIANVISWVIAVLFAYTTNKTIVFKAKCSSKAQLFREFFTFISARLFSLGAEELGLFLLIDWLHMNETISKIALQVILILLNYVLSKLFVFKKADKKPS